jgi:hypothetical protein
MHQEHWGYEVEEKDISGGVRMKKVVITGLEYVGSLDTMISDMNWMG